MSDSDIRALVAGLESLLDGELAVAALIGCGPGAIPTLRDYLIDGRPSAISQPRQWAVEALAGLGARDVLLEYLSMPKAIADPVCRLGEEAVENTAARRLAQWREPYVFETLLEICASRRMPGIIEALGAFERPEAIPCFDRGLEDDFCRPAAEEALRKLGLRAVPSLILSAITALPGAARETPSSLRRRRSVLTMLTELQPHSREWDRLRPLLSEQDPEIVLRAAQIAANQGSRGDRTAAAQALLNVLPLAEWYLHDDLSDCPAALAPESTPLIESEARRRSGAVPVDSTLLTLRRALDRLNR